MKFPNLQDWVLFTGVYGSPRWIVKKELWEELGLVAKNIKCPWLLAVDFNALFNEDDKQGGASYESCSYKMFKSSFYDHCLKHVGFQGSKFTWNRGFVFERLDRALFNYLWDSIAPNTIMFHLHKIKSDHRPLAISFGKTQNSKIPHPFRFFSGWLSHEGFG